MDSLYTPEVREYVSTRDWPKGLRFDVFEEYNNFDGILIPQLNFVFYRNNWIGLDVSAQLQAANTVKEVMERLRADGIQCYMQKMEG